MQTLFIRGPSATFRMIVLVVASIALMTIDHRWHSLEMVRGALSSVLYPLQYTIDLPIRLYYWADETFSSHQELLEKNREYEKRHLENRVKLQKLEILERENARLRRLLSATPKVNEQLLIAEIINVDVDPYRQLILINKGKKQGVYQGQPIIDAQGIMGQVVHVGLLSSSAMLISDASHAIPVQDERSGLRAIAYGTGQIDRLVLRHLPHNADIKDGDMLTSSGMGGTFPPNYPVAIVTKVERPIGETFAVVEATPFAQMDKSREVLLIWRHQPEEETTEEETTEEQADGNANLEEKTAETVTQTAGSEAENRSDTNTQEGDNE
ncbi:MAG TPA: rod shape-determining protein MreC [Gammaproteobacteria bacterium]|nr:rod shape-determining protein MreC [Gammaproteobacteria bacterium]